MDDFLTTLYQQYFQAVDRVQELAKVTDVEAECRSCGHAPLDEHAKALQLAKFDVMTWETLIGQYIARFALDLGQASRNALESAAKQI